MGSVIKIFLLTSEKHEQNCFFEFLVTVNGRSDWSAAKIDDLAGSTAQLRYGCIEVKSLTELFDWKTDEVGSENTFFFALESSYQLVDADHLNSVSRFDWIDQFVLEDHCNRLG